MNQLRKYLYPSILLLSSMWWGWTILVDIFIIPTVFRTLEGFFVAGNIGILVFSKLNNLELVVGSILFSLLILNAIKVRKGNLALVISGILLVVAMTYFSWLTPKIIKLTELWQSAEQAGSAGIAGIPDVQQAHQFYHNLYIKLDMLKLFFLTALIGICFWKQEDFR